MNIFDIPAFTDNYIWAIQIDDSITVIDPGDSKPVLNILEEKKLKLQDILITHHHHDHTGRLLELKNYISGKVYGPKNQNIDGIDVSLAENDLMETLGYEFRLIETPGHTLDHIAFYSQQTDVLFCGDTLFSAGCGRLFEGTYDQLHDSIQKINELPGQTKIYCGHEYTESNLKFAKAVEPLNQNVNSRYNETLELRKKGIPTLPSTLELELKTNPFLRTDIEDVQKLISTKFNAAKNNKDSITQKIITTEPKSG